jgi:hypothetical protein
MVNTKGRYFLPALYCLIIGGFALQVILLTTSSLPPGSVLSVMGMPTENFILLLLGISLPILAVEYYLFAIPLASMFLFANRAVKAASYEMNIMNIGPVFGGRHMIRRAAAPALFSVASSTMLREVVRGYLGIAEFPEGAFMSQAALSLMSALIFMPIALLIFMPTWVLNDSGIVTHLKSSKMEVRQCPDTQGVGRWVSSIFSGYALIAFPITMFTTYIYNPYVLSGVVPTVPNLLGALTLVFGVPLFVMAFIVPVIVVNEHSQDKIRRKMGHLAIKLGATVVEKEAIRKTTRVSSEGILAEEGGKEILTSAKTIDLEKKMKIEEQEAEEARKRAKARREARNKKKKD